MRQAHRFSGKGQPYEGLTKTTSHGPVWTGEVRTAPDMLDEPLRWKKSARIFVNSMSDLFHEDVPDEFIESVFEVMLAAQWHTFQVLTKRAERMREFCSDLGMVLPNVWLGVSVEDQRRADERIPELLRTPAAVRFLSCEPLLEAIDLLRVRWWSDREHRVDVMRRGFWSDPKQVGLNGFVNHSDMPGQVDWVIVGGESGPGARPFNIQWARDIVAQCREADVPVFVKQLGRRPYLRAAQSFSQQTPGLSIKVASLEIEHTIALNDRAGADPAEWPEDLRVQQFPT